RGIQTPLVEVSWYMNEKMEGRLTGYAEGGRDTILFRTRECQKQRQTGRVDGERRCGTRSPIGRPPGVVAVRVQFVPGPVCPVGGNSGRGRHGDVPRPCAETGGRDGGAICRESESPFVHCGGSH